MLRSAGRADVAGVEQQFSGGISPTTWPGSRCPTTTIASSSSANSSSADLPGGGAGPFGLRAGGVGAFPGQSGTARHRQAKQRTIFHGRVLRGRNLNAPVASRSFRRTAAVRRWQTHGKTQETSRKPAIAATMTRISSARIRLAGSPKKAMPTSTVPTARSRPKQHKPCPSEWFAPIFEKRHADRHRHQEGDRPWQVRNRRRSGARW